MSLSESERKTIVNRELEKAQRTFAEASPIADIGILRNMKKGHRF